MTEEEIRKLKDKGPYEHILDNNITIYDNMQYQRDIDLCGLERLVLVSGNIIKYYSYSLRDVYTIIPD